MALPSVGVRKAILFAVCLIPLGGLIVQMVVKPPVDPYEQIAQVTGETALRLLILTLLITPLKQAFSWKWIGAYRRQLGVVTFVYALAHFVAYLALEAGFEFAYYLDDIAERRYIILGSVAFMLMMPLAFTSNNFSVGKLGGRVWKRLHLLVFPLTLAACAHLYLQTRGDKTEPLIYLGIVLLLFIWRIITAVLRRRATASPA